MWLRQYMVGPSIHSAPPHTTLSEAYFDARFQILRKPLGFEPSAAKLPDDKVAIHAWVEHPKKNENGAPNIVAVGRIHLIPADSSGACADTADDNAAHCPDFPPLSNTGLVDATGKPFPSPEKLRPAVQVRQMGTLSNHQRQGHASKVLTALEQSAINEWGKCTGFLQARVAAIPFYEAQNWVSFGEQYVVEVIGLHRSMWKTLEEE